MTTENKKIQKSIMNKANKNFMQKTKLENLKMQKSLAEFYIRLTLAMYFKMLGEQVP